MLILHVSSLSTYTLRFFFFLFRCGRCIRVVISRISNSRHFFRIPACLIHQRLFGHSLVVVSARLHFSLFCIILFILPLNQVRHCSAPFPSPLTNVRFCAVVVAHFRPVFRRLGIRTFCLRIHYSMHFLRGVFLQPICRATYCAAHQILLHFVARWPWAICAWGVSAAFLRHLFHFGDFILLFHLPFSACCAIPLTLEPHVIF